MADPASTASLNTLADLVTSLKSGELRTQLGLLRSLAADCDVRCGCNSRDCGCHGSVSSRNLLAEVSLPELQQMRADRIAELKAQLAKLEAG